MFGWVKKHKAKSTRSMSSSFVLADLTKLRKHEDKEVFSYLQTKQNGDAYEAKPYKCDWLDITSTTPLDKNTHIFEDTKLRDIEERHKVKLFKKKLQIREKIELGLTTFSDDDLVSDDDNDWEGVGSFADTPTPRSTNPTPLTTVKTEPVAQSVTEHMAVDVTDDIVVKPVTLVDAGPSLTEFMGKPLVPPSVGREVGNTEGKGWTSLTDEEQVAAKLLGFTKELWNKDRMVPSLKIPWSKLAKEEREAWETLGWREASWSPVA